MDINVFVILVGVISLIIGIAGGILFHRINEGKKNKQIIKNALEVLEGKRENSITVDGEKYDATKFIMKDENDEEIMIDLKGGGKIQYGKTENNQKTLLSHTGEDSTSSRKGKRTPRRIQGRLSRFG